MRKLFNIFRKKKDNNKDFLASIGLTYLNACERDVPFRIRMEKTEFGKAIKGHLEKIKANASN